DVNLGKLMFAFALTSLVGLFADLGATTYLTREVARDPANAGHLTANLMAMRIPLSAILTGATIAYAHLAGFEPATTELISVMSLGIVVIAMSSVVNGTLQGLQQMKTIAVTSVIYKLGYALMAVLLLLLGAGVVAVAVAFVVLGAIGLIYSAIALLRLVRFRPTLNLS